jgi:DNA mismatch endonuclease (patch repair protein)
MADIVDAKTRSRMMSGIRGKNTLPEILVRRFVHRQGLRFRLHRSDLPGCPDLVFRKYRVVVFVHGCFWHRHRRCRFAATPSSHRAFWRNKLEGNRERDQRNARRLRRMGWRVIVIWECKASRLPELRRLVSQIKSRRPAASRKF